MNTLGGTGLWDEEDGFYYDQLHVDGRIAPAARCARSSGLIPLFAVEVLDDRQIDRLPGFKKRMEWFLDHRPDLAQHISYCKISRDGNGSKDGDADGTALAGHSLARAAGARAALPARRKRISLAVRHPLGLARSQGPPVRAPRRRRRSYRVDYEPGESTTGLFGGNSNWRGPIWMPINFLLIEALERYHHFYGDDFKVECPAGSGRKLNLKQVAREIELAVAADLPARLERAGGPATDR